MSPDPRERFSATVDDYRRYRPDYPDALVRWIVEVAGLKVGSRVLDVGCGTGISTRALARHGLDVLGVDPNAQMLAAARAHDRGPEGTAREKGGGDAEGRGDRARRASPGAGRVDFALADAETLVGIDERFDAIVAGQALHWLDLPRALSRFSEVLAPGGRVIAFWNLRDASDPFMAAYEQLLLERCPEYARVGAEPRAREFLARTDLLDAVRCDLPGEDHWHDREGLRGRAWSSSYVVLGVTDREGFDAALEALFGRFQVEGRVCFRYRTQALAFSLPAAPAP